MPPLTPELLATEITNFLSASQFFRSFAEEEEEEEEQGTGNVLTNRL